MSDRVFTQTDLLSRVAKFLGKSPLIGAMENVSVSCNMAFQDQSTEIADEKRFEQLRDQVIEAMEDEGFLYEVNEECDDYFGFFVHDLMDAKVLYIFRGYGHSVVLSPTGAHSAVDNVHIYSMADWDILQPWLGLGDLMELDADI